MNRKAIKASRLHEPDSPVHETFPIPAGAGPVQPIAMLISLPVLAGARHIKVPMKSHGRVRYLVKILVIRAVLVGTDPRTGPIPVHIRDRNQLRKRVQQADTMVISHPITMVLSAVLTRVIEIINLFGAILAKASMLQGPMPSIASIITLPTVGQYVRIM